MNTNLMKTESLPAPPATTPPVRDLNAPIAEDEEEMPLLFMDDLPSNFQQNAQLAAIASFMADSDDDAAEDEEEATPRTGNGGKQCRQRQQKCARSRRRQEPYAKPLAKGKEPKSKRNRDSSKAAADTKELQLFLSMFHVS